MTAIEEYYKLVRLLALTEEERERIKQVIVDD